jgi:hypothetical protein
LTGDSSNELKEKMEPRKIFEDYMHDSFKYTNKCLWINLKQTFCSMWPQHARLIESLVWSFLRTSSRFVVDGKFIHQCSNAKLFKYSKYKCKNNLPPSSFSNSFHEDTRLRNFEQSNFQNKRANNQKKMTQANKVGPLIWRVIIYYIQYKRNCVS